MSQETARRVLAIEAQAITDVIARVDASFDRAVQILHGGPGRVVVTGMGKSGLIGQKISSTLASTGTSSIFMHSGEAVHGDLETPSWLTCQDDVPSSINVRRCRLEVVRRCGRCDGQYLRCRGRPAAVDEVRQESAHFTARR